jgi:hypothetical protein
MAARKKVKASTKRKVGSARKGAKARPTKAETVQTTGGEGAAAVESLFGGNMPPVKDLVYHLDQIAGYEAKAKTASMAVKKAKDAAKSAGIDLKSLAETKALNGMDPLDMATYFRQLQVLMREKGMPVQLSLYEPKFGTVEEQASAEGWRDGKAGRTPDTVRWSEGAPGHIQYMRRWNDAQKDNLENGVGDEPDGEE